MSLLDRIDSTIPGWMLQAPRKHVGKLMGALMGTLDGLAEQVLQGRLAGQPGQVRIPGVPGLGGFDSCDALYPIARDRSIRPGLDYTVEPPWVLAGRLRGWMDAWALAGTPLGILQQVAAVLSDPTLGAPMVRLVTAGGDWWTLAGGVITFQNATQGWSYTLATGVLASATLAVNGWNWDSTSLPPPPDQNDASRFWVIVYAPACSPYLLGDGQTFNDPGLIGDYWNNVSTSGEAPGTPSGTAPPNPSPDAGVIGLACPARLVDTMRNVLGDFSPAGCQCRGWIVSFDPAAFNPVTDSTPTSIPDGAWAWHSKPSGGARVVARFINAEYCKL